MSVVSNFALADALQQPLLAPTRDWPNALLIFSAPLTGDATAGVMQLNFFLPKRQPFLVLAASISSSDANDRLARCILDTGIQLPANDQDERYVQVETMKVGPTGGSAGDQSGVTFKFPQLPVLPQADETSTLVLETVNTNTETYQFSARCLTWSEDFLRMPTYSFPRFQAGST